MPLSNESKTLSPVKTLLSVSCFIVLIISERPLFPFLKLEKMSKGLSIRKEPGNDWFEIWVN